MKKRDFAALLLAGAMLAGCAGSNGRDMETQKSADAVSDEQMPRIDDLERKYSEMEQSNSSLIAEMKELEQSNEELKQVNQMLQEQCAKSKQSVRGNMIFGEIQYTVPETWMTMSGREHENELWHFPNEKDVLIVQVYNMEASLGQSPTEEQQTEVLTAFYEGYLSKMKNAKEGEAFHTRLPDGSVAMKAEIDSDTADGRVKDTLYELMKSGYMYLFTFRAAEGGVYDEDMQAIIESITFRESVTGAQGNSADDLQSGSGERMQKALGQDEKQSSGQGKQELSGQSEQELPDQNEQSGQNEQEHTGANVAKAGGPEITLEEYEKIDEGMSYDQAAALIGSGGQEAAASSGSGYTIAIYSWDGNGGWGSNANITFLNGEVFGKSQSGLK